MGRGGKECQMERAGQWGGGSGAGWSGWSVGDGRLKLWLRWKKEAGWGGVDHFSSGLPGRAQQGCGRC